MLDVTSRTSAALLMYGSGLRITERMSLRVKDLDSGQGTITVHDGQGNKHRVVPLPKALEPALRSHLAAAREKHLQDLAVGAGDVHMPESLLRKNHHDLPPRHETSGSRRPQPLDFNP